VIFAYARVPSYTMPVPFRYRESLNGSACWSATLNLRLHGVRVFYCARGER